MKSPLCRTVEKTMEINIKLQELVERSRKILEGRKDGNKKAVQKRQ